MVSSRLNEKKTEGKKNDIVIVISDDESDNLNQGTNNSVIVISDSDDTLTEICENAKNRSRKNTIQKPQNARQRYLKRKLEEGREEENHKKVKYDDRSFNKLVNHCRPTPKETSNGCTSTTSYFIQNKENAIRYGIAAEKNGHGSCTSVPHGITTEKIDNQSTSVAGKISGLRQDKIDFVCCPFCPFKTLMKDVHAFRHFLKLHVCFNYTQCKTCTIKFKNWEDAIEHFKNHVIKCPFCLQRGIDTELKVSLLNCHVFEHHKAIKEEFPAQRCLFFPDSCHGKYKNLKAYIKHYILEHQFKAIMSEVYICTKCQKDGLNCLSGLYHCAEEHLFHENGTIEALKNKCENHIPFQYISELKNISFDDATISHQNSTDNTSKSTGILRHDTLSDKRCKAITSSSSTFKSKKVTVEHGPRKKKSFTATISNAPKRKKHKKSSHKAKQQLPSTSSNVISQSSTSNSIFENGQLSHMSTDYLKNLSKYKHIIFIDLDNWAKFFDLPCFVPTNVFVWGFCGGKFKWTPSGSPLYCQLVEEKRLYFHPKCGGTANAADFALCVQAARLDIQLPTHIPFTVLSGDRGFGELQNQLSSSQRRIHLIDPHGQEPDFLCALLCSIGESGNGKKL